MKANELTIVKDDSSIKAKQLLETVGNDLTSEYRAHKARYDRFQSNRESAEVAGTNVRKVALWVVGSIQTDTELVDENVSQTFSGDFSDDKSFLEGTTDGPQKWESYGSWFNSDIPDQVADLLRDDKVDDAHALLAGRDPDTGKAVGDYYLRTNKASLVLYLLGYDRICLDTRIYRALKPAIRATLENDMVTHPESEHPKFGEPSPNPYRKRAPDYKRAKSVPVLSHNGDPDWNGEKSYWEDKLKWNPIQYHTLTTYVRDRVGRYTDIPTELIAQVAFNTEGSTTTHETLYDNL